MTLPFRRRAAARGPARLALTGDFPDDQPVTDALAALPAWDGTTFTGTSEPGLPDSVVAVKQHGRDTEPLAFRRQSNYAPGDFQAPDPRETGPMQRMPKLRAVQQRPRPVRPADAAIFTWSHLIGQHIMKCGVCLRSRHADPTTAALPFTFEALRVSAYQAGWRLDRFARWACPACQQTPAYWAPYSLIHWDPDALQVDSAYAEQQLRAAAEHDLIRDVHDAARRYRHAHKAATS